MAINTKEDFIRIAAEHQERLRSMTPEERTEYDKLQAAAWVELQELGKRHMEETAKQQAAMLKNYNDMVLGWNLAGVRLFKEKVQLQVEHGELALLHELHDVLNKKKIEPPDWLLHAAYKSLEHRTAPKRRGPPQTPSLELLQTYMLFEYARAVHDDLPVEGIELALAETWGLTVGALKKKLQQAKKILVELPDVYSAQDAATALCILLDVKLTDDQKSQLAKRPKKHVRRKRK